MIYCKAISCPATQKNDVSFAPTTRTDHSHRRNHCNQQWPHVWCTPLRLRKLTFVGKASARLWCIATLEANHGTKWTCGLFCSSWWKWWMSCGFHIEGTCSWHTWPDAWWSFGEADQGFYAGTPKLILSCVVSQKPWLRTCWDCWWQRWSWPKWKLNNLALLKIIWDIKNKSSIF